MEIQFTEIKNTIENEAVVLLVSQDGAITDMGLKLDNAYNGIIKEVLADKRYIKSDKLGSSKSLIVKDGEKLKHIIIFSIGENKDLDEKKFVRLGARIVQKLAMLKISSASILIEDNISKRPIVSSMIAEGAMLSSYRFNKYFTGKNAEDKFSVQSITIEVLEHKEAHEIFTSHKGVIEGVFLARNLSNEPANILYPESYAKIISDNLKEYGVSIEILGEEEMKKLGMGALLGVGQGSKKESKLVVMQYNGAGKENKPIAFVGKGVTFDTGGISIKPAANMEDMKYDMSGSAVVVGLIKALAIRKAKVNVVGVVGLVENMPDGYAQRPGDVVTTMSGQTAEVLNTDAEGRLVLADALWYVQDRFHPSLIIDLATLTGAIVVALGHSFAGCFSNDDDLAAKLEKAGTNTDEKIWRMPLHQDFEDMIKSDIADVANIGCVRGAAGSATAAHFLQKFVNGVTWAHLDIAGVAWTKTGSNPIYPKGGTGFGVRLLNQFIKDYYEAN